jgi:glutamate N-acetyltransferase / amino-acid N-acetyltransferase
MSGTTNSREITGGVTAPAGFRAGGIYCGIRKAKKDLAIILSELPAIAASVFTTNRTQAAPVLVDKEQLRHSPDCRAIVVNSGNANACTGERGLADAWTMVDEAATALGIPRSEILVSSTGVIGQYLPIEKISEGIRTLVPRLTVNGSHDAAEAIMTTDTFAKEIAVRFSVGAVPVTIGAIAKGSGMIAPNMATMLGFATTDAAITPDALREALRLANRVSFNRITVDGDTSTNDMMAILANGAAGNPVIMRGTPAFDAFHAALEHVLIALAKMIARDGEGATKLIEIHVVQAATEEDAEKIAATVANSSLVKTAIHGADANWGRIIAAVGRAGVDVHPDEVEISFNRLPILRRHYEIVLDEERAKAELLKDTVVIEIALHAGTAEARFWTCDLTKEYVHINASYRS